MTRIAVYDPPFGCSSGRCGPDGEEVLARFDARLEQVAKLGVTVERHNLGLDPAAFATNPLVRSLLREEGMACLPLVMAGGVILAKGGYPAADDLMARLGMAGDELSSRGE